MCKHLPVFSVLLVARKSSFGIIRNVPHPKKNRKAGDFAPASKESD